MKVKTNLRAGKHGADDARKGHKPERPNHR